MIAEAFKKALLQAAIQGKLTEQLPGDGDARDLLKEIQKEKARLVKEGKIKKEKPLPEIKEDEIPFDIPENWAWCYLSFVTTSISSRPFQIFEKEILSEGLYPVVSQGKKLIEGYSNCQEKLLTHEKPIILFGDHTKNLKLIDFDFVVGADGTKLIQSIGILPEYLFRNLQYNVFSIGTRNYGRHFSLLNSALIAVPPIEEQKRIIHKLDKLLPEIEVLEVEENKLDNLEKAFPGKIRASILQAAIQGKLTEQLTEDGDARDLLKEIQKEKARLIKEGKIKKEKPLPEITEDEIPFDIPENWVWVRLGDYVHFRIGKTPARGESSYWGNDVPWVSISDMNEQPTILHTKEKISNKAFNKVFKGNIVPRGTLLMSFKLTIGRMSFLGIDALHNEAIVSITPIIKNPTTDNYLFKVLPFFAQTGETKGAIKGETLNSSSISRLVFPLAPLSEQKRIVEKLEELLPLCDALG